MNTYDIVVTDTGMILETVTAEWPEVQNRVAELNRVGKGVFARKAGNSAPNAAKRALSELLKPGVQYVFVDAWTSGNPGLGGYRGVSANGTVLFKKDSKERHTNNFFELFAVVAGLEYAIHIDIVSNDQVVYTDSQTVISWIATGRHNATADQESITKLIAKARDILSYYKEVSLLKWDTETYGEIPADYGRK